jgi:homoserine dehydrogenase
VRERHGIEGRLTGLASRRLGWIAASDPSAALGAGAAGLDAEALLAGRFPAATPFERSEVRTWLGAAHADVMFEASSLNWRTGQPATEYLKAALNHGAHAISANKGPIVHAYAELCELARARGRKFLFESTVMDGTPIFSLFRQGLPAVELRGFRGLLNSTSNVVLTQMENGLSFDEAVKEAQRIGVAETDPSDDLDAWDPAVKIAALANVLMGVPLKLEEIERVGVRTLSPEAVRAARTAGRPYKLICRAERQGARVVASVRPEQLPLTDPLASMAGTTSCLHFDTDVFGLTVIEHKPGVVATAYGLLADFIRAVGE